VYLFGKSDHTATFYGLNVYPENVKAALVHKEIRKYVTGKFQMSTEYAKLTQKQYLLIRVELAPHIKPTAKLKVGVKRVIVEKLRQMNAEYRKLYESIGRKAIPRVALHSWGDTRYFTVGAKQRWKKIT
jgi:phenylacetate-CoA ligase